MGGVGSRLTLSSVVLVAETAAWLGLVRLSDTGGTAVVPTLHGFTMWRSFAVAQHSFAQPSSTSNAADTDIH